MVARTNRLNFADREDVLNAMSMMDSRAKEPEQAQQPIGLAKTFRDAVNTATVNALRVAMGQGQAGNWVNDHRAETEQFKGWNYVAVSAIAKAAMSANLEIFADGPEQDSRKTRRKTLRQSYGTHWKSHVGKDDSEPVGQNHRLRKLLQRPNKTQSGASMRYEMMQQLLLTGTIIIWKLRNAPGLTVERYIIPTAATQPVWPTATFPRGGFRVLPQRNHSAQVDPDGFVETHGYSRVINQTIPLEDCIVIRLPHPLYKDDGLSPTGAGGEWIDLAAMVDRSRWSHLRNGPNPSLLVSPPSDVDFLTNEEVEAYEQRLNDKLGGPDKHGRAFVGTHDKMTPFTTTPREMVYDVGFEQGRDAIMALHGVTKVAAGLVDGMTYGSIAAALKSFSELTVQPLLDFVAEEETEQQAPEFGDGLTVELEAPAFNDPELQEQQLQTDIAAGAISKDEIRTLRGRDAWGGERGEEAAGAGEVSPADPAATAPSIFSGLQQQPIEDNDEITEAAPLEESAPDDLPKMLSPASGIAKTPGPHRYSSLMALLPPDDAERVLDIARLIDEDDLTDPGVETEPHVTVKYGLLTSDPSDVLQVIRGNGPLTIELGDVRAFPASKDRPSDVLYLEVFSPEIEKLNQTVCDSLAYSDDKPYRAHVTIAYVKPGTASKYVGESPIADNQVRLKRLVFAPHTGPRVTIPLTGAPKTLPLETQFEQLSAMSNYP